MLRSYVEDGFDIDIEDDIAKAKSYSNGIAGTTSIFVNASKVEGTAQYKSFRSVKIGSRSTHEIQWSTNHAAILESSDIIEAEIVPRSKLLKYARNELVVTITGATTSPKAPQFCSTIGNRPQSHLSQRSKKAKVYESCLHTTGLVIVDPVVSPLIIPSSSIPDVITRGWAKYPGNCGQKLSYPVVHRLNEMYILSKQQKKRKVSAERALQTVVDDVIFNDWSERLNVTVPKIEAFFSMPPAKQLRMLGQTEQQCISTETISDFQDSVDATEIEYAANERHVAASSLLELGDV